MSYSIRIKQSAVKQLQKFNHTDRTRLIAKIDSLAENPAQGSLLKGELMGLRRIRVGDYRIIYEVEQQQLIVLVIRVSHRRDVYR